MPAVRVKIGSPVGLHARPARLLVEAAGKQPVPVKIGRSEEALVSAASILAVMSLGVKGGEEVVPIINKKKASAGVKTTLNGIQAKLTSDGLGKLIGEVSNDKKDPKDVAKSWLTENGLDASGTAAKGVSLTVGSANFPENIILAEIYAGALTAQGATVKEKLNIGSREKYFPALKAGSLDLFPEYTGVTLQFLDKTATATSSDDVYAALGKALPANLIALDKSAAEDKDAVVVTKQTADKFHLKTIADLAKKG